MAMSLLKKGRLVLESKLHELLDREVNTPEGYRQLIRDLEGSMADLGAARDESVGTTNGYKRQKRELEAEIAETQSNIDLLLGDDDPNNDDAALQLQVRNESNSEQLETLTGLIADSDTTTEQLQQALDQLESRHQQMLSNMQKLSMTQAATKAKNRAASALENADGVSSDAASVDNIQANLEHQNDVASARFDRVVNDLSTNRSPEDAIRLARAKAAIDARRAEIAAQATSNVGQEQPASV